MTARLLEARGLRGLLARCIALSDEFQIIERWYRETENPKVEELATCSRPVGCLCGRTTRSGLAST